MNKNYVIKSRAPLRLGLAGGGTDVSPYCDQYGGFVLNATLDRYAYCLLQSNESNMVKFESTDLGASEVFSLDDEILLGGPLDLLKAVYVEMVERYCSGKFFPVSVFTFCDSPMGSGLGSSSTLVVAMIRGFVELLNLPLDDYQIANLSFYIERIKCGHQGGRQDQYSATFGGFNFMEFYADNRAVITPLRIKNWTVCNLEASLLLFYTGQSRKSASIIEDQSNKIKDKNQNSIQAMHGIKNESLVMKEALLRSDFNAFIECLKSGWEHKKNSSPAVTNWLIDSAYKDAMDMGALAGKVSGAGGGGFMMFFVPVEKRMRVIAALNKYKGVVSNCHFTDHGVQAWTM
ncbi:MAG: dehydrogenase [Polynucleobacter sp. 39-45-136]|nr:MAG: dehydrogenase [Polynucleobacter sp. 39-45-136]